MLHKISVIVPVYNSENTISYCINSILHQTYENIELIIVNDGSIDHTKEVLKQFQGDFRIKIIEQENKGVMYARLNGVLYATGSYVMFVDADDCIHPNMLENLVQYCDTFDVIKCGIEKEEYGRLKRLRVSDTITTFSKSQFKTTLYPILTTTNVLNNMVAQMIRKDLIDKIECDKKLRIAEDLFFNINLYQNINSIVFIPDTFYHYADNSDSATKQRTIPIIYQDLQNVFKVFGEIFNLANKKVTNPKKQKEAYLYILKEITVYSCKIYYAENAHKKDYESLFEFVFENDFFNKISNLITKKDIANYHSGVKHIMSLMIEKNAKKMASYGYVKTKCAFKINDIIKYCRGNHNAKIS